MTFSGWAGSNLPKLVATATLSLSAAWALTRLARRFAGASSISLGWMSAGAIVIALSSLSLAPPPLLLSLAFGWSLLVLTAVDLTALRLPDVITLPLAFAGLALPGVVSDDAGAASFPDRLAGFLLGVAAIAVVDRVYFRLRGRAGIGFGDAKLFGVAGAWLGWRPLPSVLLLACAAGLGWVAVRLLQRGRQAAAEPLPFGAPLCLAIWLLWLRDG